MNRDTLKREDGTPCEFYDDYAEILPSGMLSIRWDLFEDDNRRERGLGPRDRSKPIDPELDEWLRSQRRHPSETRDRKCLSTGILHLAGYPTVLDISIIDPSDYLWSVRAPRFQLRRFNSYLRLFRIEFYLWIGHRKQAA